MELIMTRPVQFTYDTAVGAGIGSGHVAKGQDLSMVGQNLDTEVII